MTGKLTENLLVSNWETFIEAPMADWIWRGGEPTFENLPVSLLIVDPVQFFCALQGVQCFVEQELVGRP